MYSIIIYLIATLCVVNASIVTINVYDEPSNVDTPGISDCNFNACDQLCRRLGFPGGACVNGRCQCDNFKTAQDNLQSSQPEVDSEDNLSLQSCNNQECNQRCRRLKFPGGVCVNGRCKCDNFFKSEDELQYLQPKIDPELYSRQSCNNQECDQRCRRLKFPSGVCVNGRCKCDNFLRIEDDLQSLQPELDSEDSFSLRTCNYQECDQRCRRLKFPGGACVNGRCKCDNFLKAEGSTKSRHCNYLDCNHQCQRRGFTGDVCVNNHCICNYIRMIKDSIPELEESLTPRSCNLWECQQRCRRMGYRRGTCTNNRCKCLAMFTKDDVTDTLEFPIATRQVSGALSCNTKLNNICDRLCRILHYTNGTCATGICKCSKEKESNVAENILNSASEDSNQILNKKGIALEADVNEIDVRATCIPYQCNEKCNRIGYNLGVCQDGVCHCYQV